MNLETASRALPFSVLLLAACASAPHPPYARDDHTPSPVASSSSSGSEQPVTYAVPDNGPNPGYALFRQGQYEQARSVLQSANSNKPDDPYTQLDLGATYQRQGRMDLAEPLYRQAMKGGHGVVAMRVSNPRLEGRTIEDIACDNLAIGLPPATVNGTARPCQSTVVTPAQAKAYNVYFGFNESTLTSEERSDLHAIAEQALIHPSQRIALVGKASRVGTDGYNMALSHRRSTVVKAALVSDGVAPERIDERWVGERELAVAERSDVREPLNRVVAIKVQ